MLNKKKFSGIFLSILLIHNFCSALPSDSIGKLRHYEDTLKVLQYKRINSYSDRDKLSANEQFFSLFKKALLLPGSYDYLFDSLTTIGRLISPDKKFRIINWNVPLAEEAQKYFGFIQTYNPKKKEYELYTLQDKSEEISNPQQAISSPDRWLGMLYFKVIPCKNYYTLLAWQGSKTMNKKIIDVLMLSPSGIPSFGKQVFAKLPSSFRGNPKRLIFRYSNGVFMSLDYRQKNKVILFDHLVPFNSELAGQYEYYGPGFQVDGLFYKDGLWNYEENVDARNPVTQEDKYYHDPSKDEYKRNIKPVYSPH